MKRYINLTLILLLFSFSGYAGGGWPGVKYSYAKVYLYNVDGNLRGMHQIIKDDKLDKTVQGEGKTLSKEQTAKLEKIFSAGAAIDELFNGLSGCYIPRHAIVYYDSNDRVVASMSICFECQGIRFYSPSYPRNSYASTPTLVKKAEEKLKEIEAIVSSLGFKTDYKVGDKLEPITDTVKVENKMSGQMFITDNAAIAKIFTKRISLDEYDSCLKDTSDISIAYDEKYTAGGEKFVFVDIQKGNSSLYFSGPEHNASLEKASVSWEDVQIFESVTYGMSLESVMGFMTVYDGLSNPEEITIQNEDGTKKIVFHFYQGVLNQYDIEVTAW